MKLVFYALAVVVLAGFAAGLSYSTGQPHEEQPPKSVESRNTVFVDVDRLVSLHPAWTALEDMRRIPAEGAETARLDTGQDIPTVEFEAERACVSGSEAAPRITRQHLEAEAARAAIESLHGLELDKRQSLWERVNSTRAAMARAAEAEAAARARDIRSKAGAETVAAEREYYRDRLRIQLKINALQAAVGIPELNTESVRARLEGAREELSRLDRACEAEKSSIASVADARIAYMREVALREVDERARVLESEGSARIDLDVARARYLIVGELASADQSFSRDRSAARTVIPRPAGSLGRAARVSGVPADVDIASSVDVLAGRVKGDITRVVEELAAQRGLKVVFQRSDAQAPDRTDLFVRLVRDRGWREFRPILSESVRS